MAAIKLNQCGCLRSAWPVLALLLCTPALATDTVLISNAITGGGGDDDSSSSAITKDGNLIVFPSSATDLDIADFNARSDIFLYNRLTRNRELISRNLAGDILDGDSRAPDISANGNVVVFSSRARNTGLTPINSQQIYLKFLNSGTLRIVDVQRSGTSSSQYSFDPTIDRSGQYIAFASNKPNLVAGDTNNITDIFLANVTTVVPRRISLTETGLQATGRSQDPDISADGRYVAFHSTASLVSYDTNGVDDIYRYDRIDDVIELASKLVVNIIGPGGLPVPINIVGNDKSLDARISADGRFIAFTTRATNFLVGNVLSAEVFVADMLLGTLTRANVSSNGIQSDAAAYVPSISANGRYVGFSSSATNLGASSGRHNVYIRDMSAGITELTSITPNGESSDAVAFAVRPTTNGISDDGAQMSFSTYSTNLGGGNTFDNRQVYLRERGAECDVDAAINKFLLESDTWAMLSLPCVPPQGSTLASVFGDDINGSYGSTWAVITYDTSTDPAHYERLASADSIRNGQGFWIKQITGGTVTLDLPVGSRQATTRRPPPGCSPPDGCVAVKLSGMPNTGVFWNLVGQPFSNKTVNFDDLVVTTLNSPCSAFVGTPCSLDDANAAGVVGNQFFHYNGTAYDPLTAGSQLSPWEGYWVPELAGAGGNSPTLVFPE